MAPRPCRVFIVKIDKMWKIEYPAFFILAGIRSRLNIIPIITHRQYVNIFNFLLKFSTPVASTATQYYSFKFFPSTFWTPSGKRRVCLMSLLVRRLRLDGVGSGKDETRINLISIQILFFYVCFNSFLFFLWYPFLVLHSWESVSRQTRKFFTGKLKAMGEFFFIFSERN